MSRKWAGRNELTVTRADGPVSATEKVKDDAQKVPRTQGTEQVLVLSAQNFTACCSRLLERGKKKSRMSFE